MSHSDIKSALRRISGSGSLSVFEAKVLSVEGRTITVQYGDLTLSEVRLRAVENDNQPQLLITPAIGSYVLVLDLSAGKFARCVVIQFSEVDSISIKNTNITIDANQITLNGGSNKGLVKIDELVSKLNTLENAVNNLAAAYNSHSHLVSTTAGAGNTTSIVNTYNDTLTNTTVNDLEDTKITH